MPGPAIPRPSSGLNELLRLLGVSMPPPAEAGRGLASGQDMPGSRPRPIADTVLGALTDFPRGMITGGNAQPGPSWENFGALVSALAPLLGKIVYHGSPHVFDRFDMSKVGTGEGAQAYGHGLYFADSPGVARQYRDQLSWNKYGGSREQGEAFFNELANNGIVVDGKVPFGRNQSLISKDEMAGKFVSGEISAFDFPPSVQKRVQEQIAKMGALYDVDLPDDAIAKMLDWDAPLASQPESVRAGVMKAFNEVRPVNFNDGTFGVTQVQPDGSGTIFWGIKESSPEAALAKFQEWFRTQPGREAYHQLARGTTSTAGNKAADVSSSLNKLGVPGIKYFDGMSRGAGAGSRNYVVFDDKLPNIVKVER